MPEVERFYPQRGASMEADPNGSYVKFTDHITAPSSIRKEVLVEVREALTNKIRSERRKAEEMPTRPERKAQMIAAQSVVDRTFRFLAVCHLPVAEPVAEVASTDGEAPRTFAELRDRYVDPEKEKLRAEVQRFREKCGHVDTTLNGDGTMTCDLCGLTEADPFAATQPDSTDTALNPPSVTDQSSDQGGGG